MVICGRPAPCGRASATSFFPRGKSLIPGVLADHPLEQRDVIANAPGRHSRHLAHLVPQANPDGFVMERIGAELRDLVLAHRSALKSQRMDGGGGELAEIAAVGRTEITLGGDVEA